MEFAGMRPDKTSGGPRPGMPDDLLWRTCRETEMPEDEAEQFLELATYAEDRLDEDDRERVAARIAVDPWLAADVVAARTVPAAQSTASTRIIERACALRPENAPVRGQVIPFPQLRREIANWNGFARWGSVAAALLVASWLGFSLGIDASRELGLMGQPA